MKRTTDKKIDVINKFLDIRKVTSKFSDVKIMNAIHYGRFGKYNLKTKSYRKKNFMDLEGSLKSEVDLTDTQLRKARNSFSKNWANN
jgi:hypothetical protein